MPLLRARARAKPSRSVPTHKKQHIQEYVLFIVIGYNKNKTEYDMK